MYHYIFFDLDGTLTDSKEGILNCLRYAFEIIIQKNKFLTAERHNIGIILCLHLWHFDAGVFIYVRLAALPLSVAAVERDIFDPLAGGGQPA